MENRLYEYYSRIRDLRGLTDYQVTKKSGIKGTATISNWKNGKYVPKNDKMQSIAEVLDVSLDYLLMNKDRTKCDTCGFYYNPLSDVENKEHDAYHKKALNIKNYFPDFMEYADASELKERSILTYCEYGNSLEEKLNAFNNYLIAEYSIQIIQHHYSVDFMEYNEFCMIEVGSMKADGGITEEFICAIEEKYGSKTHDIYYVNEETAQIAQEMKDSREFRLLMHAARDISKEDMLEFAEMMMQRKRKERGDL